jgi:PKD repeat protein
MNIRSKTQPIFSVFALSLLSLSLTAIGQAQTYANVSRSSGVESQSPRITVDPAGNIHVVWAEFYTDPEGSNPSGDAFYSKYNILTQQWSSPLNLSNSGQCAEPEWRTVGIDSDPSGNIYVVYIDYSKILLRIFEGGSWGSSFEVGSNPTAIDDARVAVDAQGNILVSWWELDSGTMYTRARVGGAWESVKQMGTPGVRGEFPDVAVGTNVAYCVWYDKSVNSLIFYGMYSKRAMTYEANWSAPKRFANTPEEDQAPAVEIDGNNIAHIVWSPIFNDGDRIIRHVYWTGSDFSSPQDIGTKQLLHYPSLYKRGSNLYAAWQVGPTEAGAGVFYNDRIGYFWIGERIIPNSSGNTFADVATSPAQDKVYYVWDSGGEIWCSMGLTGIPPPPTNKPPVPNFSFSPTTGIYPLEVTFDASASYDPDGSIDKYIWIFGDGATGSGPAVTHTYTQWGVYSVQLSVTDNLGASAYAASNIIVLRLFQPLGINWETHPDESLFMIRYITEVKWERNPANDNMGAQIVLYRVWRKKTGEADSAYKAVGEVTGNVFSFLDNDVEGKNLYTYTVTAVDNQGHESPILPQGYLSGPTDRPSQVLNRKGRLKRH